MATITAETGSAQSAGAGQLFLNTTSIYGDFRDDLLRDGYAVVKGAILKEKVGEYVEEMYQWLENLFVSPSTPPFPPKPNIDIS